MRAIPTNDRARLSRAAITERRGSADSFNTGDAF